MFWPGATEPNFMNGDSSWGSSTNGTPRSNYADCEGSKPICACNPSHLGNVLILVILFSIVVDEDAAHPEIRQYRGMFFLYETDV